MDQIGPKQIKQTQLKNESKQIKLSKSNGLYPAILWYFNHPKQEISKSFLNYSFFCYPIVIGEKEATEMKELLLLIMRAFLKSR